MDKRMNWWDRYKPTRRRLIQLYAALLSNAHAKGFIEGEIYTGNLKNLCVPGLNCYSCPGAVGSCPLGALQNALASSSNRAPSYVLGILLLLGLTLGRTICGWLCPMGLFQELLHKLPTPKLKKGPLTRALSWLKYGILAVFVVLIPLHYSAQQFPVPAFCKYICPAGTLEGAVGLLANPVNADKFSMLGILFTRKFMILVLILTGCVFLYRMFCRFLCPLGAIYGLFNRFCLLGVQVNPGKCIDCGRCVSHCQMDIRHVADQECIQCGECMKVCPTDAIQWKGGKWIVCSNEIQKKPSGKRSVLTVAGWCAALALLAAVMIYVNLPEKREEPTVTETVATDLEEDSSVDSTPVGKEVGMQAPDFIAPLYAGGDFTLSETRGKVVVINFWATWCSPCVAELPHFQQVHETWPEDVAVVALHSDLVTDDVDAFIEREGFSLPFALDADGSIIESFGGSTMLPMTVILDRTGKIVYNRVASINFEELNALIEPLL